MKTRTVYKLVAHIWRNDKLMSSYYWASTPIEYKVGKTTIAPFGTKIFCFDSVENAKSFRLRMGSGEIYKSEASNVSRPKLMASTGSYIKEFWAQRGKKRKHEAHKVRNAIRGTLWCDSLTLIEQIV